MTAIYGYIRGSLAKQVITIQAQREKIEQYAKLYQLDITSCIEDEATTSKIPFVDRPGGSRIQSAINKRKVTTVIVAKLDRAFRSTVECLRTVTEWNKRGINLHVIDFHGIAINTQSSTGKLMLTFFAAIAEWERDVIAERTREAHLSAQRNGKLITRPDQPPYGTRAERITCAVCQTQPVPGRHCRESHLPLYLSTHRVFPSLPDQREASHEAACITSPEKKPVGHRPCSICKGRGWLWILVDNPDERKVIEIIRTFRKSADGKVRGGTRLANILNAQGIFYRGGKDWERRNIESILRRDSGSE